MQKRHFYLLSAVMLLFAFFLSGCGSGDVQKTHDASEKITVTDMVGRQVSINMPVERVVAVGPGALRLYCYVNGADGVAGVEQTDKKVTSAPVSRTYRLANPSLAELDVIGPGGPNNAPDPEKILAVRPDVIFSTYTADKASVEALQEKTGIPVVALSYGEVSTFDPDVYGSLRLIGKITGRDAKVEELIAYMENCRQDLHDRTKDIPDDEKPSVYIGALSARGTHGIESTQGKYSLFEAINAANVADETGKTGSIMIDKEKLIQWDPDKIFIDKAGFAMVQQDYQKNPEFYGALSAVKNGELYSQLPYNSYHTNIDTAMADAYYLGKVIYPEQFKDVDPEEKADEIYRTLVGKPLYAQMAKDFGGFEKLALP